MVCDSPSTTVPRIEGLCRIRCIEATIYFTPAEADAVRKWAEGMGMSLSSAARCLLLEASTTVRDDTDACHFAGTRPVDSVL